jgi:hypothetical protein
MAPTVVPLHTHNPREAQLQEEEERIEMNPVAEVRKNPIATPASASANGGKTKI